MNNYTQQAFLFIGGSEDGVWKTLPYENNYPPRKHVVPVRSLMNLKETIEETPTQKIEQKVYYRLEIPSLDEKNTPIYVYVEETFPLNKLMGHIILGYSHKF